MAKRNPPLAGYYISCLCGNKAHSTSCTLDVYSTNGTLKNMQYVHHLWGTGWCKLTWTCFPFQDLKLGKVDYYPTLADLKLALGTHKINSMI